MSVDKPLVSVLMITYNQAEYIEQALTSVLDQICKFEFEVILSNDASSDNSDELISDLIENHSNGFRVKYFNQPINLGMNPNLAFSYGKCNGKYIAICEGDDYWTDSLKIQKQVDFLESNPDFVLCYHPVDVLFPDERMEEDFGVKGIMESSISSIFELAVFGNYIHTPSVVFKKVLRDLPLNFNLSPLGDFFLWVLIAQSGLIKKINGKMAVYRYGVGIHSLSSNTDKLFKFIRTLDLLSQSVENSTIKEILENRILAIKSSRLPSRVRNLEDYSNCLNSKVISEYVSWPVLFKAIGEKLIRRLR